jgi:hypothetical protein
LSMLVAEALNLLYFRMEKLLHISFFQSRDSAFIKWNGDDVVWDRNRKMDQVNTIDYEEVILIGRWEYQ